MVRLWTSRDLKLVIRWTNKICVKRNYDQEIERSAFNQNQNWQSLRNRNIIITPRFMIEIYNMLEHNFLTFKDKGLSYKPYNLQFLITFYVRKFFYIKFKPNVNVRLRDQYLFPLTMLTHHLVLHFQSKIGKWCESV